jgi:3D (Asp-Asp-Asp) domain-containing protein
MTHTLAKTFASRITRTLVSLAVGTSSVALMGAIRPQPMVAREHVHGPAVVLPATQETLEAQPAAFSIKAAKSTELLHDAAPASAVSTIAAKAKGRVVWMQVTAYCACKRCCGPSAHGLTASGRSVSYNSGQFVAADTRLLPFNTKLIIPGYANDKPVEVIDRGGAIKGNHIDLFFPTHDQARQWGVKWIAVTVLD